MWCALKVVPAVFKTSASCPLLPKSITPLIASNTNLVVPPFVFLIAFKNLPVPLKTLEGTNFTAFKILPPGTISTTKRPAASQRATCCPSKSFP